MGHAPMPQAHKCSEASARQLQLPAVSALAHLPTHQSHHHTTHASRTNDQRRAPTLICNQRVVGTLCRPAGRWGQHSRGGRVHQRVHQTAFKAGQPQSKRARTAAAAAATGMPQGLSVRRAASSTLKAAAASLPARRSDPPPSSRRCITTMTLRADTISSAQHRTAPRQRAAQTASLTHALYIIQTHGVVCVDTFIFACPFAHATHSPLFTLVPSPLSRPIAHIPLGGALPLYLSALPFAWCVVA